MTVGTKSVRRRRPLIPTRRPTRGERALYWGVGILAAVILDVLAFTLDWSRSTLFLAGIILVAVYAFVATPLLLGRRADR